jgi:arginine decarboxylase
MQKYHVAQWGRGYFSINRLGHLTVHPDKDPSRSIDLKELVDELGVRGHRPPILIRFMDILHHRMREIAESFERAIHDHGYDGSYCCVYPIKVNQQRHVVEAICDFGAEHGFGLEVGSKPELLAVLAIVQDKHVPIICNGFKDNEFIEMVVLAQKIGKRVIPVVEKFSELELIVRYARIHGIRPMMGIRVKLATRGSGRWEQSGGARSKFGLFVTEVGQALDYLRNEGMAECVKLLHFHLGSQITNIRNVKDAVNELARVYVQLKTLGAGLEYLDIGGGLGVDYDGSRTNYESSMNYTLEEYASDVVFQIKTICDEALVVHPTIITESGRAMVAYHSVLVFNVLGVSGFDRFAIPDALPDLPEGEEHPQPLIDLFDTYHGLNQRNALEYYHDAVQGYDQAMNLFNLGYMTLDQRCLAESLFWGVCSELLRHTKRMQHVPEDLDNLPVMLADTYFCNFSVFQSMPDSWAIDQRFPIMPIHRLDEPPTRTAVLADITCDSDGKIDHFIDPREDKCILELHPYDGSEYLIGAFLIGAYQEILGDMHNLLGDTHAVHVSLDEDGRVDVDQIIPGDTVRKTLEYVQFSGRELLGSFRRDVEKAVKEGSVTLAESAQLMQFYEKGLDGYTYLE